MKFEFSRPIFDKIADLSQSLICHDSSRQQYMWMKSETVITVKTLLMMSDNIARNMYNSQETME
jgi:hypothetical protein